MSVALTLIVLRCSDLPASKLFYEALGLELREERHRPGPTHWSCDLGGVVLELYPADHRGPSVGRLGFAVEDLPKVIERLVAAGAAVEASSSLGRSMVVDPDGTKIELEQRIDAEAMVWNVWRQDDNGNRAVVSRGHRRSDADRLARKLEAKGHKQMYWVSVDEG